MGCHLWGRTESDMSEATQQQQQQQQSFVAVLRFSLVVVNGGLLFDVLHGILIACLPLTAEHRL